MDAAAVARALKRRHDGERAPDNSGSIATAGDEVAELTTLARQYRDIARA